MTTYIFSFLASLSFVVQLLSVFIVFKKVDSTNNKRYRFFQVQFLAVWGCFFYTLYSSPPQMQLLSLIASLLIVGALGLFFYCSSLIQKNKLSIVFSEDSPEFHISNGPYSLVRHPFYSSYIYTYVGIALGTQSLLLAGLGLSMMITYYLAARFEERKFLSSNLQSSYQKYIATTGMFFPRFQRLAKSESSSESIAS